MSILTLTRPAAEIAPLRAVAGAIGRGIVGLGRVLASIRAAQKAAADYERLSGRGDSHLGLTSLTRANAARLVFERHYS